jgi:hypothetical protein
LPSPSIAPPFTLIGKWDTLISVFHLMDKFPELPKLQHILGHQDDDLSYQNLPLDAQMNTQADTLATMELDEYATPFHHVPFNPESRAMFSINRIAVTRQLKTTIRTHAPLPALITYYKDHLNWDERTFHVVDREVFGTVYPKMRKGRNFIIKFASTISLPETDYTVANLAMTIAALPVTARLKPTTIYFNALLPPDTPGTVI